MSDAAIFGKTEMTRRVVKTYLLFVSLVLLIVVMAINQKLLCPDCDRDSQ